MSVLDDLHASISRRLRPEDVAELIRQELGEQLSVDEVRVLDVAASGAHSRQGHGGHGYSSMPTDFRSVVGMGRQLRTAHDLFPTVDPVNEEDRDQPDPVRRFVSTASGVISKQLGESDFKAHRLNRERRTAVGLGELSKRQYNKRFRLLARMERKLETLEREIRKREYTLVSKSRLASHIPHEEFVRDRDSACFIAYLTARANRRSVFTNGAQTRAYDEIADMLFRRCQRNRSANWWAIAHIHPDREVLSHLSDEQKGQFLATWFGLLTDIAGLLREVWEKSRFDRATMIVRRGDDSTTWNATAGAWNKAREAWIALLHALDLDALLDRQCPGKVLRLMAADVAAWHRASGGGLEPDTAVWADLPPPWEVLDGSRECGRAQVVAVCRRHKVPPVKKGWTAPRTGRKVAAYRPTPELVHGVAVGHPGLALVLRKLGVFSGKALKLPAS